MNRLHLSLLAAATGLLLMSNSGTAEAQQTVRCESQGGAYRSCPVSTSGGVSLSRQLSREGCWQNDTWGYDRNRIWVTRGCRAEFRVGSHSNNNSDGAKVAGALVLGAIVAGAIAENKDNHHNDHRNDWDNDRYNGSYNGGYDYGYGNNGYYGNGNSWGREFTCSSKDNRTQWCGNVARREHVEVRRQLSNTPCSFGRTWGVDRGQVWVSQGCRAVFVVY
jgi:hypothetical protein